MGESTGFLLMLPVLAFSIWLLNFTGNAGLASAQMSAATQRGADEAAAILAEPPDGISPDGSSPDGSSPDRSNPDRSNPDGISPVTLRQRAEQRATNIVNTAALGVCVTTSDDYSVEVSVVTNQADESDQTGAPSQVDEPSHVVVVKATCPLTSRKVAPTPDSPTPANTVSTSTVPANTATVSTVPATTVPASTTSTVPAERQVITVFAISQPFSQPLNQ